MEQQKCWKATWFDQCGQVRELNFTSAESRIAAGIDFKLLLLESKETIPQHFELAESQDDVEETVMLPTFSYTHRRPI